MRLSEQQIRKVIKKIILEQSSETKPNLRAEIESADQQALNAAKVAIGISGAVPALVDILISLAQGDSGGIEEKVAEESANSIIEKLLEVNSNSLKIKSGLKLAGGFLGAFFLAKSIYDSFTYLPTLMQKSIDQMKTVEGILLTMRKLINRPLEVGDISTSKEKSPITGTVLTQKMVLDTIASSIASGQEGQSFYGKLLASQYTSLAGIPVNGPVISQDFATTIQKRRKELESETTKKIQDLLVKNWSKLTPKEKEDFEYLAKLAAKRKDQTKA